MTFFNTAQNLNMDFYSGFNSFNPGISSSCNPFMANNSIFSGSFNFTPYSSQMMNFSLPAFNFSMPSFNMPMMNFSMPAFNMNFSNFNWNSSFTSSKVNTNTNNTTSTSKGGLRVLEKAESYVGKVNSDVEGVRIFSPKGSASSRGWCCDFATYCASKALGDKYPKDMITGSPGGLRDAAKKHGCWVNGWNSSAKPGDIVLLPGNGASGYHNAIIKSINGDKITCISGNSGGKKHNGGAVLEVPYSKSKVIGFVSMSKLA